MKLREQLWVAEGRKCHWCQIETRLTNEIVPDQATIDHVIPRGRGGSSNRSNCVSACSACNQARNKEDQRQNGPLKKPVKVHPLTPLQIELRRQRESEAVLRQQLKQYDEMSVRAFALKKLVRWLYGIELKMHPQTASPESTQAPST